MIDKKSIIDGISEVCRHRSVSHIVVASSAYKLYAAKLTKDHKKKGIKNSTCHNVGIFPVNWIPDEANHVVMGFNPKRSKKLNNLHVLLSVEENDIAEDIITQMLEDEYRYLHVFHLPTIEENDEASGE